MQFSNTTLNASADTRSNRDLFQSLLQNGTIQVGCIDGLDGSGKQSAALEVAKILEKHGVSTLIVSFPYDFSSLGKQMRKYLSNGWIEQDEYIDLPSRRTLYALNRAQTIEIIINRTVEITQKLKTPVKIIFDRCPTSILVTFSAEKLYQAGEKPLTISEEDVANELIRIYDIDANFISTFGIDDLTIHIPMVSPETTVNAIVNAVKTGERKEKDVYEKSDIQSAARMSYLIAAKLFPQKFHVFSQMLHDRETRMSKEQIGKLLYESFKWNDASSDNKAIIETLTTDIDSHPELINESDELAVLNNEMAVKVKTFIQPFVKARL